MTVFFTRLLLWLGVLAVMTFFWVGVFDAREEGLKESLLRNAHQLRDAFVGHPEPR